MLAVFSGCSPREAPVPAVRPPNVVLVWVDDLGALDTRVYGSVLYDTPAVDRLAGEGARFTQFYSASPVCSPTRASLMTGKHPARVRITNWIGGEQRGRLIQADYERSLPLAELTVGEAFQQAGYATAYLGKWHLGARGSLPEDQGFEFSRAVNEAGQPASYFWPYRDDPPSVWDVPDLDSGPGRSGEYLTDRLTDEAVVYLEQHLEREPDRPFFLVLSHYAVHTPIEAPPDSVAHWQARIDALPRAGGPGSRSESGWGTTALRQDDATYAAMVSAVDRSVERLMASLEAFSVAERTIVVLVSDNGGLSTLGGERSNAPTSNEPLRAGKGWLYEGGVRIPMLVRWPGHIAPGIELDVPATTTDIYPTLLELAGLAARPEQHADGLSLAGVLRGGAPPVREALFWHFPHYHGSGNRPSSSIRETRGLKLIEWLEDGRIELYDLTSDPSESFDLSTQRPEDAARLRARLAALRAGVDARMPIPDPEWPDLK